MSRHPANGKDKIFLINRETVYQHYTIEHTCPTDNNITNDKSVRSETLVSRRMRKDALATMSRKTTPGEDVELSVVKVEAIKSKTRSGTSQEVSTKEKPDLRVTKALDKSRNYAYDNKAYIGSVNNVNDVRCHSSQEPPTGVYREQYWACSKWSWPTKAMAIGVGVLLGAGIVLLTALLLTMKKDGEDAFSQMFLASAPD
ncbi:hypothetical protein HW555_011883 [Spodoptera exigua]|uniref:Uncharacterized protein n=1 Tax=Spodoptera exigua TaxID=7107 RepID=A0A835L189_SPOEX|nr:hypothetical protein HW555_011883 [Spodoptera exigua]